MHHFADFKAFLYAAKETRTPNLLIRSQMHYPIVLWPQFCVRKHF